MCLFVGRSYNVVNLSMKYTAVSSPLSSALVHPTHNDVLILKKMSDEKIQPLTKIWGAIFGEILWKRRMAELLNGRNWKKPSKKAQG